MAIQKSLLSLATSLKKHTFSMKVYIKIMYALLFSVTTQSFLIGTGVARSI
jgi:hypothetical protein